MTWNKYTSGTGYYSQVWKKASSERMVKHFEEQLNSIPRYKILVRIQIMRNINFWQSKINEENSNGTK